MRWTRRPLRHDPWHVDLQAFDDAAERAGFLLDEGQRRAARVLAANESAYLHGPPGRGKSWLMTAYYDAVPTDLKLRTHFHEFFRELHLAVHQHHDLDAVLDDLLNGLELVCFDEFHVHDPADGIFITRLLRSLIRRDIRVVLTSNYPPGSLLPNPLFHDDFLPTIALIEETMTIVTLDGRTDYRTTSRRGSRSPGSRFATGHWVVPGADEQLDQLGLRRPTGDQLVARIVNGRRIRTGETSDGRLWIDYADLCDKPTATADYLTLAEEFTHWVIDGVPDLRTAGRESLRRFANVVDVVYDRDVTVVFLSAAPLSTLSNSLRLVDGDRIRSRLSELARVEA